MNEETTQERKAPHGMRFKVTGENGKNVIVLLASLVKHKPLKQKLRNVSTAQHALADHTKKLAKLAGEIDRENTRFETAEMPDEERDTLRTKIEQLVEDATCEAEKEEALHDAVIDAIVDVYRCALAGAGYNEEEREQMLALLHVSQYEEIRSILRTGCGYADFTERGIG